MHKIAGIVLVLLLLLSGCANDDDDASTADVAAAESDDGGAGAVATNGLDESAAPDSTQAPAEAAPADAAGEPAASPVAGPSPEAVPVALQPVDLGRDIIFVGNKVVAVDDVVAASTRAQQLMAPFEAFVFGQESLTEPEPRSTITFKVAPGDFNEALAALSELGDVVSQTVSAEDVTDRVGDLESRITTAEISVGRLQGFLSEATDLNQISQLEAELLRRETDLEVLRGQLRTLQTSVALATINLTLVQFTGPLPASGFRTEQHVYEGHDEGAKCAEADNDEVEVDDGSDVTVCVLISNVGDSRLGELQIADEVLGITLPDFIVVEGDTAAPLEPDGQIVVAYEIEAQEDQRTATDVSLVPVSEGGISLGELSAGRSSSLIAIDDAPPGFGDVLGDSAGVLASIGQILLLVVAALLPFTPLLLIAGGIWLWTNNRRRGDSDDVVVD